MKDYLSILRIHIVLIAIMGTLVFGRLICGEYLVAVALIAGIDWILINLANRVSDITEDMENAIPGTWRIQGNEKIIIFAFCAILAGSFIFTAVYFPQLTFWRILIQITGILYNFKLIPAPNGRFRLKDQYFFKNFMSAFGFFITCFGFTLAMSGYSPLIGWKGVVALVFFFMPFELTFEIFYDLRDVPGDSKAGVKTYPVVHGSDTAINIINALLGFSLCWIIVAFFTGMIGARELLMAFAPVILFIIYRKKTKATPTSADCVMVTHIGSGLLVFYLVGTAIWLMLGLPANIHI